MLIRAVSKVTGVCVCVCPHFSHCTIFWRGGNRWTSTVHYTLWLCRLSESLMTHISPLSSREKRQTDNNKKGRKTMSRGKCPFCFNTQTVTEHTLHVEHVVHKAACILQSGSQYTVYNTRHIINIYIPLAHWTYNRSTVMHGQWKSCTNYYPTPAKNCFMVTTDGSPL